MTPAIPTAVAQATLLAALADLAVEHGSDDERPLELSVRQIRHRRRHRGRSDRVPLRVVAGLRTPWAA